jgi:hypothetical protein
MKFPVNSLLAGESSETGSLVTPSSSSQSVSAVNAEAVREKPRTLAAFCGRLGT